jgi:hypothetical protein
MSLTDQITALERALDSSSLHGVDRTHLKAAAKILRLVHKYEAEVRDLLSLCIKRDEELPGSEIRMSTPHSTAVSAIAQERDEGGGE